MRSLVALFVLLVASLSADAAAPVLSVSYSRTSCTAPCGVVVDATATTDADTTKPFHDLFYTHTFGDPSAGLWANGANTALSKNFATGAVAGHIYETAGTYTITTTASDNTTLVRTTQTITVSDPNTTYAGTATVCIGNVQAVAGVGGCPEGASTPAGTSDGRAALASCFGNTKRCLYKRGDSFNWASALILNSAGPNTIGAYGTGAKPIFTGSTGQGMIAINGTNTNDLRIMDIDCRGTGVFDSSGFEHCIEGVTASGSGVTILRVDASNFGSVTFQLGWGSGLGLSKTIIQDSTATNGRGGELVIVTFPSLGAILGNSFGPVIGQFQTLRVQNAQKAAICFNTITNPGSGPTYEALTVRPNVHATNADDTFFVLVCSNDISNSTAGGDLLAFNTSVNGDERTYDVIAEGNRFRQNRTSAGTCAVIRNSAVRASIRNNLIDMSGGTACGNIGTYTLNATGAPVADGNMYFNNTYYSSATNIDTYGPWLNGSTTNAIVKNNLCRFPNASPAPVECVHDAGTGTTAPTQPTAGGNSSNAQATGTDPLFDGPLTSPIGFRIGTTSYAASGGTNLVPSSINDFFNCDDTTANERIGAFVPRTRATCRGAAGP